MSSNVDWQRDDCMLVQRGTAKCVDGQWVVGCDDAEGIQFIQGTIIKKLTNENEFLKKGGDKNWADARAAYKKEIAELEHKIMGLTMEADDNEKWQTSFNKVKDENEMLKKEVARERDNRNDVAWQTARTELALVAPTCLELQKENDEHKLEIEFLKNELSAVLPSAMVELNACVKKIEEKEEFIDNEDEDAILECAQQCDAWDEWVIASPMYEVLECEKEDLEEEVEELKKKMVDDKHIKIEEISEALFDKKVPPGEYIEIRNSVSYACVKKIQELKKDKADLETIFGNLKNLQVSAWQLLHEEE